MRAPHLPTRASAVAVAVALPLVLLLTLSCASDALDADEEGGIPSADGTFGGGDGELDDFFNPAGNDLDEFFAEQDLTTRSETEELIEGIAAQVGGGVVLVSEVRRISAPVEARMSTAGAPKSEILRMRSEALEQLIEARLIEDVVRRTQLTATEAEVNDAVAAIARENGLTLDQMAASISSHGLTLAEYRAKIKSEIERNKVLGQLVSKRVSVEDHEIATLYDARYGKQRTSGTEIHLRHLLVGAGAAKMRDRDTACRMVEEARTRIFSRETRFEQEAKNLSDANAEQSGDLGWVHTDDLASWMAPAVANLQPGQISEVIPMYFGCNLLMVVNRREVRPVTLEQARPELETIVFRQKMEVEYREWIAKVRETVYIELKGVYAEADRVAENAATQ